MHLFHEAALRDYFKTKNLKNFCKRPIAIFLVEIKGKDESEQCSSAIALARPQLATQPTPRQLQFAPAIAVPASEECSGAGFGSSESIGGRRPLRP